MNPDTIGLRERKKASQKLSIMHAFISALEQRELSDIKVDDICDELGISKVTFFNYFDSKEHVLEYFVHKWQFEIYATIMKQRLSGRKALRAIFDSVGNHPAGRQIMNAVVQFFLKQERYVPMQISEYELYLFDPEAYNKGARPKDIRQILSHVVGDTSASPRERKRMVEHLIAGFYGVPIRLKITGENDLAKAYREFLQHVGN